MILVDTSVWIEFWGKENSEITKRLKELIKHEQACITGIIYTEILQGARSINEQKEIEFLLNNITVLPTDEMIWKEAPKLYYDLRKKGITVETIDCIIAVIAIKNKIKLFTLDKHFKKISKNSNLELF